MRIDFSLADLLYCVHRRPEVRNNFQEVYLMDKIFTSGSAGTMDAPQQPNNMAYAPISALNALHDLDFDKEKKKGKKKKKGKHKKRKQAQREAQVERLSYAYGAAAYENLMLRRMMSLALAAQRGKLHVAPIEVGFEVLDGKEI